MVCSLIEDVSGGSSLTYEAICVDGIADVSIFVFVGEGFVLDQTLACQKPLENSPDLISYDFKLSCTPICESLSPTFGPIPGPTPGPTQGPTSGPTVTPSREPTPGPTPPVPSTRVSTPSPSRSFEPTECIEKAIAELESTNGASVDVPEDAIKIVNQGDVTVEFVVNQLWNDTSVEMIAILYQQTSNFQVPSKACTIWLPE